MSTDEKREDWTQDGSFADANDVSVRAYDDVRLLHDVEQAAAGNVSVEMIPAGSQATVLFFTTDAPRLLDLECYLPGGGFVFAHERADRVAFAIRSEDKHRGRDVR